MSTTSNGDAIALAYNNDVPVNGIGVGQPPKGQVPSVGQAVNALIDLRDTKDVRDGLAMCECALPSAFASVLPALLAPGNLPALVEPAVKALQRDGRLLERDGARREAHKLAGTLGAFGVHSGSVVARDLETAFEVVPPQSAAPGLAERVLTLRRAVEAGPVAPEASDGVPRVVLAGLASAASAPILRAAEGHGWRVSTAPSPPGPGRRTSCSWTCTCPTAAAPRWSRPFPTCASSRSA